MEPINYQKSGGVCAWYNLRANKIPRLRAIKEMAE
jgi:hypothetical protein